MEELIGSSVVPKSILNQGTTAGSTSTVNSESANVATKR